MSKKNPKTTKNRIVKIYIKLNKTFKYVSLINMKNEGVSKDSIKYYFGSLGKLDEFARKVSPKSFKDIPIEELLTKLAKASLDLAVTNYKRFIVTTAVTGQRVDVKAFKSLKYYCKRNKAKLLVLVCSDPAHRSAQKGGYGSIDKLLQKELIITEDTALNSNLFISTIKTSAKQINPITGLARIGQGAGSFIYASPKQMLKLESTSNEKMPHAIMTTGAITKSNYNTNSYMSERLAYLAEYDHKMGAIVVEIEDKDIFHYRQVQFDSQGRFVDYGKLYNGNTVKKYAPEAIIPGDWHSGETDPKVKKAIFEMIKELKPKKIILHDVFNGLSINHHEQGNMISKARRSSKQLLNLEDEIKQVGVDLEAFTNKVNEIIVVKSNHDVFLSRYLSECDFRNIDPQNLKISLELALAMLNGSDPLKYAVAKTLVSNKIKWLKRDEDYKIAGIQCGSHGDQGPNGSRGTLNNMEKAYSKSFTGHSHTPGIQRDAWAVGTSTYHRLGYNEGPSSWLQTAGVIYPNGMRQLINTINGKYRLK